MTGVVLFLYALGGVLLLAAAAALVRAVRLRDGSSLKSRALPAALALFGSAFCLRLAAGLGAAYVLPMDNALDDLRRLASGFEIVGDSLVHAMQTFSMDEDYTLYLLAGKEMLTRLGLPAAAAVYGVAATLVNVAAPITGGAILLDILCDFFPALRYHLHRSRVKFIFNELNEASILLAEDIRRRQEELGGSVGILFVNTTIDDEDERESHLSARAQAIGAFCFTRDVPDFALRTPLDKRLHWTKSAVFLLMSRDGAANMETALQLDASALDGVTAAVLVFSDDPGDGALLDAAANQQDGILRMLVPDQRNTVLRLLADEPLYRPLLGGGYPALELLVVGSGPLAEEFICQWIWCGQLLFPGKEEAMPLRLVALAESEDARRRLEQALRHRMPGFFTDEYALSMARLELVAAAPGSDRFDQALRQYAGQVSSAAVCLEDEALCRRTAMELQRFFHLRELTARRPVDLFCYAPREGVGQALARTVTGGCRIRPFGALRDRYSIPCVFLEDLLAYAICVNGAYNKKEDAALGMLRSRYNMDSSLASAIHFSYKLFSAGAVPTEADLPAIRPENLARFPVEDPALLDRMAWLEHRRWCAWAWSEGFVCLGPDRMKQLVAARLAQPGAGFSHKDESLRLHPCLVPSDLGCGATDGAFWARVDALWQQYPDPAPQLKALADAAGLDPLDRLSLRVDRLARLFYRARGESPFGDKAAPKKGVHEDFRAYDYDLVAALPRNLATYRETGNTAPAETLRLLLMGQTGKQAK